MIPSTAQEVDASTLPLLLIYVEDRRIRSVSPEAAARIGFAIGSLVGRDVLDLVDVKDRLGIELALRAMADGDIDFFRARCRPSPEVLDRNSVLAWVRSFVVDGEQIALVLYSTVDAEPDPLAVYLGSIAVQAAVGTVDEEGMVTSVSREIASMIDVSPQNFVGRRLLTASKYQGMQRIFTAAQGSKGGCTIAFETDQEDSGGRMHALTCILGPRLALGRRSFVLFDGTEALGTQPSVRTQALESHLRRIALEVQASGVLEGSADQSPALWLPEFADLTSRQLEVLTRLRQGQRVRTIADALFISESTVRNTLSAIFKRFNVHSQRELIEVLTEVFTASR